MTAVMALLNLVKALPRAVWGGVAAFALLVGCWWAVASYGGSRYEDGRQSVLRVTQPADAARTSAAAFHTEAVAKTDTVIRRVTVTRLRVDTLVEKIADSVQMLPDVSNFIRNTYTLSAQVDTLTRVVDVERAAARLRFAVDSSALVSEKIRTVALTDTVTDLRKRPRWRTVVCGVALGATLGFLGGLAR